MFIKILSKTPENNIRTTVIECDQYEFFPDDDREDKKPDLMILRMHRNGQEWSENIKEWCVSGRMDIYVQNNDGKTMECIYRNLNKPETK